MHPLAPKYALSEIERQKYSDAYTTGADPDCGHVWKDTGMQLYSSPPWDVHKCEKCGGTLNRQHRAHESA